MTDLGSDQPRMPSMHMPRRAGRGSFKAWLMLRISIIGFRV